MPTFKPVKIQIRMPDAIIRQIEEKILLGRLKPFSMLPSENQMVKEYGKGIWCESEYRKRSLENA
jgi:hypothetical protein